MANRVVDQLINGGSFFECPRWHDGRWWVSDFHRHSVFAVTPDGSTFVVAETMASRMTAFTIDGAGGLSARREWARLAPPPTADGPVESGPDGCCLDAEGAIWVADAFRRRCLRIAEGGAVL